MALPASIQPLRPVEDGPDATSADLVSVIRRFGQSVRLRRGQLLFREGERADTVYLLESGNFRSTLIFLDGRRQIIGFYGPGDLIGVSSGDIYDTWAEAITTAQATGVRRQWLNSLVHDQS